MFRYKVLDCLGKLASASQRRKTEEFDWESPSPSVNKSMHRVEFVNIEIRQAETHFNLNCTACVLDTRARRSVPVPRRTCSRADLPKFACAHSYTHTLLHATAAAPTHYTVGPALYRDNGNREGVWKIICSCTTISTR